MGIVWSGTFKNLKTWSRRTTSKESYYRFQTTDALDYNDGHLFCGCDIARHRNFCIASSLINLHPTIITYILQHLLTIYTMPYILCTPTKHARVVAMQKANILYQEIAKELAISESSARRTWNRFHETQDWYRKTH